MCSIDVVIVVQVEGRSGWVLETNACETAHSDRDTLLDGREACPHVALNLHVILLESNGNHRENLFD